MLPASSTRVVLLSAIGTRINPYIGLLRDGLSAAGAEVRVAAQLSPADLDSANRPDVIHVHWLERLEVPAMPALRGVSDASARLKMAWRRIGNTPTVFSGRRWLRLRRLFSLLRAFQRQGGRVAFTVHNLDPHESGGRVDRWATRHLLSQSDIVHVHDDSTAGVLAKRFDVRRCIVIPHGHYVTAYENTVPRAEARARLDLRPEQFVFVSLGLVRPYKGQEELLPAFRLLDNDETRLIVAGKPISSDYAALLTQLAGGDPRIRLELRFVPPEEVQLFFNAADVCVLPYRQITTSGAALLALSFGLPIVAPAIGSFPTLIEGRRGILYDPVESGALTRALGEARTSDWRGAREENLSWALQFDWTDVGRRLLAAYSRPG